MKTYIPVGLLLILFIALILSGQTQSSFVTSSAAGGPPITGATVNGCVTAATATTLQTPANCIISSVGGLSLASISATGNILTNASASTSGSPNLLGFIACGYCTLEFNDANNVLQTSPGGKLQISSYYGLEIGGKQLGTRTYVSGSGGDPSVTVRGGSSNNVDIMDWVNYAGAAMARIDPVGNLNTTSVQLNFSGPSWTTGAGSPSGTCVNGSIYSNTTGTAGSTFYTCVSTAWLAVSAH